MRASTRGSLKQTDRHSKRVRIMTVTSRFFVILVLAPVIDAAADAL